MAASGWGKVLGEDEVSYLSGGRTYMGQRCPRTGLPHGTGVLMRPGGRAEYEGEFCNGLMHGRGVYTFDNGDEWQGTFRDNQMHGFGVLKPERQPQAGRGQFGHAGPKRHKMKRKTKLSPEEEAAMREAEEAAREKEILFWKGRRVCDVRELSGARVRFKVGRQAQIGTVQGERRRAAGKAPLFRVHLDGDCREPRWWDLSAYELQVLRERGLFALE